MSLAEISSDDIGFILVSAGFLVVFLLFVKLLPKEEVDSEIEIREDVK